MGFNDLRINIDSINVGITDLINSFFNAKEFFNNNIYENEDKIICSNDLDSIESHKQFFEKFPIKDGIYELPINYKFRYKNISICLNGRVDAYSEKQQTIYELKVTEKEINELIYNGNINLFKIQLFIYSYILYKKKYKINKLILIIASTNQKTIKEFVFDFELKKIYNQIKKLFPFLYDIYLFEISKRKNKKENPIFPYNEYKPIQKEIINNIFGSNSFITFVEAPFASGKTVAVLYGLARKYNFSQIHYFTSRNIQKMQVLEEGEKIGYKSIVRKSFSDSCVYSYIFCKNFNCKYYIFPMEKYSILKENGCPVIYQRLFYSMFDLIISDYNYLFYQALSRTKDTICVIDEYHSFLNRISDFFTISIKKEEIENIKSILFIKYKKLEKYFYDLFDTEELSFEEDEFPNNKYYIDEIKTNIQPEFIEILTTLISKINSFIKENSGKNLSEFETDIFPFYQKLKIILELSTFDIVISYSKSSKEKIFTYKSIKTILNKIFSGYKQVIGISATLEPKQLLYNVHDPDSFSLYSKNIPKKIRAYIIDNIETTYKNRGKNSYKIANIIKDKIYEENKENLLLNRSILLFFPSYEFIGMVELFILDSIFDKILLTKEIKTNNSSSRFFNGQINEIEDFFIDNKIHLIFVPYRSIIQEGANLNFDIAGGFFIGIPFRVPDNQYLTHSILINEYSNLSDESPNNSFEILSLFPALNDVLQSSGRIGRKRETDNFIYFIGKEFLNNKIYDSIIDCYSNVKILKS